MTYDSRIHHRRSIRLKGYDYAQAGFYFITLCCQDRKHLFGHIQDGRMCLNTFGAIAWEEWLKTPTIRPNITLGAFIVMPNHIHGIIEIRSTNGGKQENIGKFKSPSQTIGAIIRGYKGATSKRIKAFLRHPIDTGELQFDSANGMGTGELQFAPTNGEFAPADFAPTQLLHPKKSIWQRDYYDIIIRDERAHNNISNYINNNPIKWEADRLK